MKYASLPRLGATARSVGRDAENADGWWVQFGDTQFIYAATNKWSGVTAAIGRGDLQAQGDIRKGDMHLVVQKGRTFQQAHPDIPVILDKGRYLIVEVSKARARSLAHDDDVCFEIGPLLENSVAFEVLAPAPGAARADVSDIVDALDEAAYIRDLTQMVSYPTRLSPSAPYQQAADWAMARLTAMGYETRQEPVSLPGGGQSRNVIAAKVGTGSDPQQIITVAHLDSINQQDGPDAPAPGADDNASGAAGLLALASVMANATFEHDLLFILFGGEEQGLHGSTQFVAGVDPADKARTTAVLNMDMIGHVNTTRPTVLLEGAPLSQDMIDGLASAAAQFTTLTVQSALNPFASDHVSFIDAGIPAVLTIEGADDANDAIHTANDTLDRVDPAFAMEILRMNAGYLAERAALIANAAPQPQSQTGGCGCGPSENMRMLAMHYQQLLAQYGRLQGAGLLHPTDQQRMQALRAHHDQLIGAAQKH